MQLLGSQMTDIPVMSLHTGGPIGQLEKPVIDPSNLMILAYTLKGPLLTEHPSLLRVADIREMGHLGMIVDGSDEIIGLDDVVKIKELYELSFSLIGMNVVDEHKHKLGKVEDYTIEATSFSIQKLKVKRGFFKGLTDTGPLIHRSQIVDINRTTVTVKSTAKKVVEREKESSHFDYVNPFRKADPQPDA
ncbi:hypothetical protein GW930_02430 [Candidatus Saccharibacteria bacterium]|nr:hypothetical protein [Candidatus Saccharibacteria bacterium]